MPKASGQRAEARRQSGDEDSGAEPCRTTAAEPRGLALALELITDLAGLDGLEREWNDLFERAGESHQLFQGYNWIRHWCRTYLDSGRRPGSRALRIVAGRAAGRLVMVWPLICERKRGIRQLCWIGAPVSQYSDVLVEAGPDRMAWLGQGWRYVTTELDADLICLPRIRGDAAVAGLLRGQGLRPAARVAAPFADLAGIASYDAYATRFSARERKNRRRQRRRLAELGPVTLDILSEGPEARAVATDAIALKRRWLRHRGLLSRAFSDGRIDTFFANVLASTEHPVGCRVVALKVAGELAAAEIGLVCRGRYAAHISTYSLDPKFARGGAGALVREASIRNCLETGVTCYDLMGPDDAYKYKWTRDDVEVFDYVVPLTALGRLYAPLGTCAHAMVKSGLDAAPRGVRRMIASLVDQFA